jgi:hypothetical protein
VETCVRFLSNPALRLRQQRRSAHMLLTSGHDEAMRALIEPYNQQCITTPPPPTDNGSNSKSGGDSSGGGGRRVKYRRRGQIDQSMCTQFGQPGMSRRREQQRQKQQLAVHTQLRQQQSDLTKKK